MQQPKGTETRVEEVSSGFRFTNRTTIQDLLDSINLAINRAFEAGKVRGYKIGLEDGSNRADEADIAYERGQPSE